jgi:hypothetical protein
LTRDLLEAGGPGGEVPDPEFWIAETAAARLGPTWEAVKVGPPLPFDPNVIYNQAD